jgi:DNA primase
MTEKENSEIGIATYVNREAGNNAMDGVKPRTHTSNGSNGNRRNGADVFQLVKEQISVADYFTNALGVELRKTVHGYQCSCPFHEESTPSCDITEDNTSGNGRFRCWGCGAKGSVIDAVMLKNHFEKPMDAVKWLAREYKIELPQNRGGNGGESARRERRTVAVDATAKRSEVTLWDAASKLGGQGRKALRARGLSEQTIKAFDLGASIDERSGPRITIPVGDAHGQVVTITRRAMFDHFTCDHCGATTSAKTLAAMAAGGRGRECPSCGQATMLKLATTQMPKYLNESVAASGVERGKLLYNEHAAAERFLDGKLDEPLVVAEGYGDVWAAHEAGHQAAVAYAGASLSDTQARRLVELASRARRGGGKAQKFILLVPDFDDTGREGVIKNLNILQEAAGALEVEGQAGVAAGTACGVVVRVLTGLDGYDLTRTDGNTTRCKDLGELLQAHGADAVRQLLQQGTVSPAEWRILAMLDNDRYSRDAQIHGVAQILQSTPYTLGLSHLVQLLAEHWELSEDHVRAFIYTQGLRGDSDVDGPIAEAQRLVQAQREIIGDETLSDAEKLSRLTRLLSGN